MDSHYSWVLDLVPRVGLEVVLCFLDWLDWFWGMVVKKVNVEFLKGMLSKFL